MVERCARGSVRPRAWAGPGTRTHQWRGPQALHRGLPHRSTSAPFVDVPKRQKRTPSKKQGNGRGRSFPPRGWQGVRGGVGSGAGGPGSGTPRDLDGSALCARLGSASRVSRSGHANAPVARASSPPPGPPAPLHIQTVRRRSKAPQTPPLKKQPSGRGRPFPPARVGKGSRDWGEIQWIIKVDRNSANRAGACGVRACEPMPSAFPKEIGRLGGDPKTRPDPGRRLPSPRSRPRGSRVPGPRRWLPR